MSAAAERRLIGLVNIVLAGLVAYEPTSYYGLSSMAGLLSLGFLARVRNARNVLPPLVAGATAGLGVYCH